MAPQIGKERDSGGLDEAGNYMSSPRGFIACASHRDLVNEA